MDFDAGSPILGASIAALLLFTWLQVERRAIRYNLRVYGVERDSPEVTARLEQIYARVRWVVLLSTPAAPLIMFFSGQLDAYGIAHIFDNSLQIIAPLTSACFAAAVAWLLIVTPIAVHGTYCEMLERFRCPRRHMELW